MSTIFPRYKVVSENGICAGSKIIDLVDGKPIAQISRIELIAEPDNIWRARIDLVGVAVDVGLYEFTLRRFWWRRLVDWFHRQKIYRHIRREIRRA